MINIITSLWGTRYSHDYIQRLYNAVSRNYKKEFKFYCQTDQPLNIDGVINLPFTKFTPASGGGRFPDPPKLNVWEPNCWGISGRKIYLDLDVLILGDIGRLENLYDGIPVIGKSWWQEGTSINNDPMNHLAYRGITNGSVYVWEDCENTREIWNHICKNDEILLFVCDNGTDGYLSTLHLDKFKFVPRDMMYSYYNESVDDPYKFVLCTIESRNILDMKTKTYFMDPSRPKMHLIESGLIKDNWI